MKTGTVNKFPLKSEILKAGTFKGEIIDCYAKEEWGRVYIMMRNEDLVVAKADWLLVDNHNRPVEGGYRAFNKFVVAILNVEDLLDWQDIEQACQELVGKKISYVNTPQFGEKTGEYYNRFSDAKLLDALFDAKNGTEQVEQAEPEPEAETYDTREQVKGYPYLYRLYHLSRETDKVVKLEYYFVMNNGKRSKTYKAAREAVEARDLDRGYTF
jgi:hypothetical protein